MSKPFKIVNLESFEIELLEDFKKGSRINLRSYINDNDLNDLLVSLKYLIEDKYVSNKINEKEENLKKDYLLKEQKLNYQEKELEAKIKESINEAKDNWNNKFNEIIKEKEKEINELKSNIKSLQDNKQLLIDKETYKLKQELQNEILTINNKNKTLEEENNRLKREKNSYSVKHAGTEFENWCKKQLKDHFELMTNDTVISPAKFIKDQDTKEKTASDLIVEIKPNPKVNKIYKIVLEMKTENLDTRKENRKTNEHHLTQLIKDMQKNKAEFGVLVTELEPEDNFTIKRPTHINGVDNVYIIRPNMLVSFIQLLRLFFIKFAAFEDYEIDFHKKEHILETWNDFKSSFNTTFERWRKNVEKIVENANKIKNLSEEILDTIDGVSETHINTLENKVKNFKIENKIIKEIEKLKE